MLIQLSSLTVSVDPIGFCFHEGDWAISLYRPWELAIILGCLCSALALFISYLIFYAVVDFYTYATKILLYFIDTI